MICYAHPNLIVGVCPVSVLLLGEFAVLQFSARSNLFKSTVL